MPHGSLRSKGMSFGAGDRSGVRPSLQSVESVYGVESTESVLGGFSRRQC